MNKRQRQKIDGWLIIDKPEGMTSAQVVAVVKGVTNAEKVGHAGTLDPLASGVLPIALGEATKTVSFAMDHTKEYLCTATFGQMRDTDDREGQVVATCSYVPAEEEIQQILPAFTGHITQVPPVYSAIKVHGMRAYALARAGELVEMQPREVVIHALSLLKVTEAPSQATFQISCSKGTYIRALARDIGIALKTYGYVSYLRRTKVGNFSENDAISLDRLREIMHNRALQKVLLSVDKVLDDIPALVVNHDTSLCLRNGQKVPLSDASSLENAKVIRAVTEDQKLVALGSGEMGYFKPTRVFNY